MAVACVGSDEFWRECASWLTKLELLRADHRANWDSAIIADLANTLRDGVLLCNLLNKLDSGCIDLKDVNQKPAMAQFLCLRNIRLFLRACTNVFGLKDTDLFEESMLFDLTNFHQVLCTLSKLSLTPKALRHNVKGFSAQSPRNDEEEDIYQSLKHVNHMPTVFYDDKEYYQYDNFMKNEEVYQDLCIRRDILGTQLPLEKRDYVIKELIDTEKNYVEVLTTIKDCYIYPLSKIMEREHHVAIFSNIREILEIHVEFRNNLVKVQKDKTVRLSNIFMSSRDKFLVYGTFCANLSDVTSLLQELCDKNETLNLAILKCDKDANNGKFKLRDLLQVPMQRILKYHLLLEKLVDSTDPNHEEYKELKRARESMLDVASYINEMARDKDHMNILKEVARNMVWDHNSNFSIEMCGRLRKDGEIKVKEHGDNKPKTRYAFIFDKYIFLTKQGKGNQFVFRTKLDLVDFKVDEFNNRALLNQGARWTYQWHMVKHDQSLVYTMSVKSIEIKEIMIKAIKDAIDNVRPNIATNHKFTMHTFLKPTTCYRCSKYLKGSIYQGYICQVCQIHVHKECILGSGRCGIPPPPPPSLFALPETSNLQSKLWFAGEKDRLEADRLLENRKPGTFLVRIRMHNDVDRYALSLKTHAGVKHMKICSSKDRSEEKYYLSISRYFKSLEEMVLNYQQISLKENFERLDDAKLEYPYRQIISEATKPFHSLESNSLSFDVGDVVIIISKDEYKEGWCKGITRKGVNCVTILGPTVHWIPLDMKITVPSHGFVRTPMLVKYHMQNKSSQIVHVDVSIEGSEAIMFMGYFPSNHVIEKEEVTYDAFA